MEKSAFLERGARRTGRESSEMRPEDSSIGVEGERMLARGSGKGLCCLPDFYLRYGPSLPSPPHPQLPSRPYSYSVPPATPGLLIPESGKAECGSLGVGSGLPPQTHQAKLLVTSHPVSPPPRTPSTREGGNVRTCLHRSVLRPVVLGAPSAPISSFSLIICKPAPPPPRALLCSL
ncbi:hypothetical protein HJG60_009587 [Phyllostomus discolor]|uniref:Uncharacterized protein n=1 Tax=Phyllostomus discolor TaxID=89673 RepID=A0A833YGT8_9CHIR|nr:hypothetical protein HJG60_009587 [Phyllostomus discolor]